MTTIGELVDEISDLMHAYTGVQEQMTYLTAPIAADDLALAVQHPNRVTLGLIEVDTELMLVADVSAGTVQLFPDGRAEQGSVAASHSVNARVRNDPLYPKAQIFANIRETLLQIHPDLFQVKTTQIPYNPSQYQYNLPADLDRVLQITYQTPGPWKVWPKMPAWRIDKAANATDFASGKSLWIGRPITAGYKLQIEYAAPYGTPAAMTDTFASLGIQESIRDVLKFGTAWRLTQSGESARLQLHSMEQLARQEAVPAGANTNLAKQWYAMFAQRRAEERKRLLDLHPAQIHRTC